MDDDFHIVEYGAEPEALPNSDEEAGFEEDEFIAPTLSQSKNSDSKQKSPSKNNKSSPKHDKKHDKIEKPSSPSQQDDTLALKSLRSELTKELNSLKQEKKEMNQLKNEIQKSLDQNVTMNNEFRTQIKSINDLHKELEKEISSCSKLRTSVEAERTNLKLEYEQRTNKENNNNNNKESKENNNNNKISNEKWNEFETYYQKNENLYHKLNEYYANINNMNSKINQELSSLTKLKQQQQDLINNCQHQLTSIRKVNVNEVMPKVGKITDCESSKSYDHVIFNDNNNNNNNGGEVSHENTKEEITEVEETETSSASSSNNNNNNANLVQLDKLQAYACKKCGTHIAKENEIESRCYQVGQGNFNERKRGYLFKNGYNLELGNTSVENFTTGSYTISWACCLKCKYQIGWKYLAADNTNNQNKVGKYCLGRYNLTSPAERNEF